MKLQLSAVALVLCAALLGCSGGNSSAPSSSSASSSAGGGTVQAASGFSKASVVGGYGFVASGQEVVGSADETIVANGVFTSDGNGNLTAGNMTETLIGVGSGGPLICSWTLSGTYTINADGTGTAVITTTPTPGSCNGGTLNFSVALANAGHQLFLVQTGVVGTGTGQSQIFDITAVQQ